MNKKDALLMARNHVTDAEWHLEHAILCTPTGEARNLLTEANIQLKRAMELLDKEFGSDSSPLG